MKENVMRNYLSSVIIITVFISVKFVVPLNLLESKLHPANSGL